MTYSDCDPDRPTTPESRLRDALEADVARHLSEVRAGFGAARAKLLPSHLAYISVESASLQAYFDREAANNALRAQQMAMNNPFHNPYCHGMSQHVNNWRLFGGVGW